MRASTIPSLPSFPSSRPPRRRARSALWPIALLTFLCAAGALAQPAVAATDADAGIRVQGHGTAFGSPDLAEVVLGVEVADADVAAALAEADARMTAVREAALAAGVAERDIRTTVFNVWREERFPEPETGPAPEPGAASEAASEAASGPASPPPATVRFRVVHLYSLTLRQTDALAALLSGAVEAGANTVSGITFAIADPAELERRAREAAMADARERAGQLAALAGVTLGRPLAIAEVGSGAPEPMFREMAMAQSAPVAPGQLSVSVAVDVRYAVEANAPR